MIVQSPGLLLRRIQTGQLVSNFGTRWQFVARRSFTFSLSFRLSNVPETARTRNIGIIAHIDAGKTTTTERMLFYSGYTRRIGDVDDGSTVTDFLPAERARGITIQSAAITFEWPPKREEPESADLMKSVEDGLVPRSALSHHINLIDTPGHADFTFEVRRSLRVLDGAVCILDGVAGVEAQTEQVWKQAGEWSIPRIVYVNKLDRDGAAFSRTVREVASRLGGWPAVCQIPWWEGGKGRFTGIADVVNLRGLLYAEGGDGRTIKSLPLQNLDTANPPLAAELTRARIALVELLSEHDDSIVDHYLENNEDHLAVPAMAIWSSLRKCLLSRDCRIIPLFAGASFRNIGVQPLLDAVINLLPDPSQRPDAEISAGAVKGRLQDLLHGKLAWRRADHPAARGQKSPSAASKSPPTHVLEGCALAFKVANDPQKGVLVYIRVYAGSIHRGAMLYNSNLKVSEKATNLLRMYASDSVSVQSIEAGQIGVITGLKYARTGDTLIASSGNKLVPPEPLNLLQLRPIEVPPPTFVASIEPNSLREEKDMHQKLALLLREDPSLQVTQDEDTGQTLLSGMGELHLEIAQGRLVNDLKAKATMGSIEIGYRETIVHPSQKVTKIFHRESSGRTGKAGCTALVNLYHGGAEAASSPDAESWSQEMEGNRITVLTPSSDRQGDQARSSEKTTLAPNLTLGDVRTAYLHGALAALSRGPKRSYQMSNVDVTLTMDPATHVFGPGETTISTLSSAARLATTAALKDATAAPNSSNSSGSGGSSLMEPVMDVTITVDEDSLGSVVQDLSSSRGGHVVSLEDDDYGHNDDNTTTNTNTTTTAPAIDLSKIYTPPDPFGPTLQHHNHSPTSSPSPPPNSRPPQRTIKAKVPLKEMVGYLKHLRSITGGRGTFVMRVDRFERMNGMREKAAFGGGGAVR